MGPSQDARSSRKCKACRVVLTPDSLANAFNFPLLCDQLPLPVHSPAVCYAICAKITAGSALLQELNELLETEIGRCEGLLEAEADRSKCKWPILTMARLLELRDSLHVQQTGRGPTLTEVLYDVVIFAASHLL